MQLEPLFYIAIILIAGLAGGTLMSKLNLPNITGYLIVGMLLGPAVLGVLSEATVVSLSWTAEVALSFVALTIGASLKKSYFRRVGTQPLVIAACESFGAWIAVTVVMLLFGIDLRMALTCGAIASATAPAITLMVIRQFKAKGPLAETLLAVVAIDDAFALVAFGISVAVINSINAAAAGYQISLLASILDPFWQITKSLLIGGVFGTLAYWGTKLIKNTSARTILLAGLALLGTGLTNVWEGEALLTCMVIGVVYINIGDEKVAEQGMLCVDNILPPLITLFFVVAGAELKFSLVPAIGLVGAIHLVMRMIGKWGGAYLGGKLTKSPAVVCKYMGPALFPQAGVAIGLAMLVVSSDFLPPDYANQVLTIALVGSLLFDTVGSIITKFCLQWAGEIGFTKTKKSRATTPQPGGKHIPTDSHLGPAPESSAPPATLAHHRRRHRRR